MTIDHRPVASRKHVPFRPASVLVRILVTMTGHSGDRDRFAAV